MNFSNEKTIEKARRTLIDITDFLDSNNIPYHLDAGTLLGIIRDGDILPWDHDLDISISLEYANDFNKIKNKLILKGYRVTSRISTVEKGPVKKGNFRIFKVKPLWKSILKNVIPSLGENSIILDVFVISADKDHAYWQAMKKLFKVDKKYFTSSETIAYRNRMLKIPIHASDYLTERYGNWKVPVKEWNTGRDDKSADI